MRIKAVKEDNLLIVGDEILEFDFTLGDNIHAVEWDGVKWIVEYKDIFLDNEEIFEFSAFEYLKNEFDVEKNKREEEEAYRLANLTYDEKRAAEYPSIANQLDMIYHDSVNGTTNWLNFITAVKEKYPKG